MMYTIVYMHRLIGLSRAKKNGSIAGTSGLAKRLEAIQIVIIPKGEDAPNPLPAAPGAAAYVH